MYGNRGQVEGRLAAAEQQVLEVEVEVEIEAEAEAEQAEQAARQGRAPGQAARRGLGEAERWGQASDQASEGGRNGKEAQLEWTACWTAPVWTEEREEPPPEQPWGGIASGQRRRRRWPSNRCSRSGRSRYQTTQPRQSPCTRHIGTSSWQEQQAQWMQTRTCEASTPPVD